MISVFRKTAVIGQFHISSFRALWPSAFDGKIIRLQWPGSKASVQSIYMESWSIIISVHKIQCERNMLKQ